ncbi:hypothetical protein AARAC_010838 [Aspergillus arachidicola]|uniref:Uncharacterized protein n=1 Tax=Aspergillus arachidicola TaxID=656916 RepID=A0A2G7FSE0_9EURO|nr:hypothetical protein AARAC_010838 [Aspergillus arachidicola]
MSKSVPSLPRFGRRLGAMETAVLFSMGTTSSTSLSESEMCHSSTFEA